MAIKGQPRAMSRIFHKDGRVEEHDPRTAYLIWLTGGVAIRVKGDNRPVMSWEYNKGIAKV